MSELFTATNILFKYCSCLVALGVNDNKFGLFPISCASTFRTAIRHSLCFSKECPYPRPRGTALAPKAWFISWKSAAASASFQSRTADFFFRRRRSRASAPRLTDSAASILTPRPNQRCASRKKTTASHFT